MAMSCKTLLSLSGLGVVVLVSMDWAILSFEGGNLNYNSSCNFSNSLSRAARKNIVSDAIAATAPVECSMLALLYENEMYFYSDSLRKHLFSSVINPDASDNKMYFEKARKKLARLTTAADDYVSQDIPADVLSWNDTVRRMPQWIDPLSSYVCHRDDPDILPVNREHVLLQRVVEKLPCYMHAPVIMQHYLITKYSKSKREPAIFDIVKYIRESFDRPQLFEHIFEDEGMPSYCFLRIILDPKIVTTIVDLDSIDAAYLRRSGPVLLSEFYICDDFAHDGRLVYDHPTRNVDTDEDADGCIRSHAMLIIGVRAEGSSRRFLVQNWWRHYQFLEMSMEYLHAHMREGPFAYAVVTPLREDIRPGFARPAARYAETGSLDAREMWARQK
jgi:hypothetical protein